MFVNVFYPSNKRNIAKSVTTFKLSERSFGELRSGHRFCYVFLIAWVKNIDKYVVRFFFCHSYSFISSFVDFSLLPTSFFSSLISSINYSLCLSRYDEGLCLDLCIHKQFLDDGGMMKSLNGDELESCSTMWKLLKAQMKAVFQPEWQSILQNTVCDNRTDEVFVFPSYKLCELGGKNKVRRMKCYRWAIRDEELLKVCRRACPERREVDDFKYEVFFPDDDEVRTQEHDNQGQENTTTIFIQNQNIKKVTTRMVPKISFGEGVGLVGGYLGFFIGASVISLLEFGQFLLAVIYSKFCPERE